MTDGSVAIEMSGATTRERRQDLRRVLQELVRNKAALLGLLILVGIAASAIAAPLLAPFDPTLQEVTLRLKPPGWTTPDGQLSLLGTDHLGRDILSRLIFGARISLIIGVSAVALAGTLGTLLGLVAGYRGGRVDDFVMRLTDTMLAMPFILLALAVIAVLGSESAEHHLRPRHHQLGVLRPGRAGRGADPAHAGVRVRGAGAGRRRRRGSCSGTCCPTS